MRTLPLVLATTVLSAGAAAQNEFMIYPERNGSAATFVSRSANTVVEQFLEVPGNLVAGVGDNGTNSVVTGHYHWAADEEGMTGESYHVVFRNQAVGGGPDPSAAGLITRVGPINLPTGTGRIGFRVEVTFGTPLQVPSQGGFYPGVELTAANWPTDGHSIWVAWYNPPAPSTNGENVRAGAPSHAWSNDAGVVATHEWSWRMGVVVSNPVLNPGGIDPMSVRQTPAGSPNYGAGGLYPDVNGAPRSDGLELRIEDRRPTSGTAVGFISGGLSPIGIPLSGVQGRVWIDVTSLTGVGSAPLSGGVAIIPLAAPGSLPPFLVGTVHFQAVVLDLATQGLSFSNAAGVNY